MLMQRLVKLIHPAQSMAFSKMKTVQAPPMPKQIPTGFKPAPNMIRNPTVNPANVKPGFKNPKL